MGKVEVKGAIKLLGNGKAECKDGAVCKMVE